MANLRGLTRSAVVRLTLRATPVLLCVLALSKTLPLRAEGSGAGVIIWKEYTQHDQIVQIVQGHKQWWGWPGPPHTSQAGSAEVHDLDKGVKTQIDYVHKTYYRSPFPEIFETINSANIGILKPTGRRRKIAGYWCEEYRGSGESTHWGASTEVDCISNDAPGVAEYNQFVNLLDRVYVDAESSPTGESRVVMVSPRFDDTPYGVSGIPLESIVYLSGGPGSGMVVTKIESKAIPAGIFDPPAGFVEVTSATAGMFR